MNLRYLLLTVIVIFSLTSLSCEKEVSTSPPDPPVSTGFISVESNPQGATIFINGRNTGKTTPDSIRWLKDDNYKITLKLKLFRDTVFYAKAEQNKKNQLSIDYFSNPLMYGAILCTSKPNNAQIKMNGLLTDKHTPYTFTHLWPGTYSIAYQSFGCREDSQLVTVESNKTSVSYVELTDTTIWVNYNKSNSPLPAIYLNCITVDNNSVKWIGTDSDGLIRFDDKEWRSYTPENSPLPDIRVTCIANEGFKGSSLWIGTSKGLVYFDGSNWKIYRTDNSKLPDNYINAICIDPITLAMWVGTSNGLVKVERSGNLWTVYDTSNSGLQDNFITKVGVEYGKVWVGTGSKGLASYDGKKWTTIPLPGETTALSVGLTYGGVWAAYHDYIIGSGHIGGVVIYENGKLTEIKGLPSKQFQCITAFENIRWVGSADGLFKFTDQSTWTLFTRNNSGLPENFIKDIAFDSDGTMWIATLSGGVVKYKANKK